MSERKVTDCVDTDHPLPWETHPCGCVVDGNYQIVEECPDPGCMTKAYLVNAGGCHVCGAADTRAVQAKAQKEPVKKEYVN